MLKDYKIILISFFCLLMVSPQFTFGNEIDSLNTLLSETHNAVKKIEIYTLLSKKYQQIDIEKAEESAMEAKRLSESTGNQEFLGEIYGLLGDIAVMQDSLDLARKYYETSMGILKNQDDIYSIAGVAMVLGNIAFVQDNLLEALQFYHSAVDYASQSGRDRLLDDLYLNIGSINYRMKNIDGAQEYYTKALESFIKNGDSLNIAAAYSNLGLTYVDLNNYNLAEDYFSKALKIYLSLQAYHKSARTYLNMAASQNKKHNYNQAIDFLLSSLDYINRKDDTYSGPKQTLLAQINNSLGLTYLAVNDFQKARQHFMTAYKLGLSNGQVSIISETAEGLAQLWEKMNQPDSALHYQKVYKTFSDSLINEENIKKLAYQDARFEFEQKAVVSELEREKESDRQKRNRMVLIFIIAGLVMILLLMILFLKLGRNKVKRIELERKALKAELELRNKELTTHVLYQVKNNEFTLNLSKKLKIALSNINPENRKLVNDVIREIEMDSSMDSWKEFELRFQNVHTDFYKNLSRDYPDLTSSELRICAFLKLNMSTKDISAITYQSGSSIKVARWRIRQKFGLDKEASLVSFLSQY